MTEALSTPTLQTRLLAVGSPIESIVQDFSVVYGAEYREIRGTKDLQRRTPSTKVAWQASRYLATGQDRLRFAWE
ncbi:hypothetical protein [Bradyrhizobium brasilense]|uniref:Uncharacterized protein n=1 Tax=Bradyrhizobium brasilense TaxID=1419277 RepID=A0ABY8JAT6_9BRAD|nr:hypothetical protein [Bradyrhizobium brasilense]WFU62679.1 hypothetical protein QA636_35405 [Bradyrhizobium brasilense]